MGETPGWVDPSPRADGAEPATPTNPVEPTRPPEPVEPPPAPASPPPAWQYFTSPTAAPDGTPPPAQSSWGWQPPPATPDHRRGEYGPPPGQHGAPQYVPNPPYVPNPQFGSPPQYTPDPRFGVPPQYGQYPQYPQQVIVQRPVYGTRGVAGKSLPVSRRGNGYPSPSATRYPSTAIPGFPNPIAQNRSGKALPGTSQQNRQYDARHRGY